MDKPSRTFRKDDSMREALNWLARSSNAAVPVVDNDGHVIGLLTEKDALRTIAHWSYDQVSGGTVGDYMSPLKVRLTPEMDLLKAVRAFLECNFSCLPVIDDQHYVGDVTRSRLLEGMAAWASSIDAEQDHRVSARSEIDRPSSIEEMQRVAASHTPDQLAAIFRER
jgi:predicted transcriptional regulator